MIEESTNTAKYYNRWCEGSIGREEKEMFVTSFFITRRVVVREVGLDTVALGSTSWRYDAWNEQISEA